MISELPSSPEEQAWKSERGELRIRRPTPLVVVFIERGFLESAFAANITAAMNEAVRGGAKPHFFVDGEHLDGYDPEIRTQASGWLGNNREKIVVQHMLVKSRLAKMGLAVASLMLGGVIQGHHERKSFDEALQAAILKTRARAS